MLEGDRPKVLIKRQMNSVPLGEIIKPRNEIIHPRDKPTGRRMFVGLEHIESHTGRRTGSVEINLAKMTGRRAVFKTDDIVYGYLRPYLNKVWIAEFDGLCSVDQYVFIVDRARAITEYVAFYMRSPLFLELAPIAETPGQLPRIRSEEVAQVPIPLPLPDEQRVIVARLCARLANLDRAKGLLVRQQAEIEAIHPALMRAAFSRQL